jgi:hypothetical protein
MSNDYANLRNVHFKKHMLSWVALRHFLTAPLIRDLSATIVEQIGGGNISLNKLFNEYPTSGPEWMESWFIHPCEILSPLEYYLQRRIRSFAWQSDIEIDVSHLIDVKNGEINPIAIENAIKLGKMDLFNSDILHKNFIFTEQSSISILCQTIIYAKNNLKTENKEKFLSGIVDKLSSIVEPLDVIFVKHIGDLCADADAWILAYNLYDFANSRIKNDSDSEWSGLLSYLKDIILQSSASAIRIVSGSEKSASLLFTALDKTSILKSPILYANASYDALVANQHENNIRADRRAILLLPPLLQITQNGNSAIRDWIKGGEHDLSEQFWAILRRQIALGLATESRFTKSFFARSIIDGIINANDNVNQSDDFRIAIQLLIESEISSSVSLIRWSETLVNAYVSIDIVNFTLAKAQEYSGSLHERYKVVVELFQYWTELISLNKIDVAEIMLKKISFISQVSPTSVFTNKNLGGRCMEIIYHVARARPELGRGAASEVAEAIIMKLKNPTFWKAREVAFDIASEYGNAIPEGQFYSIIETTLDILEKSDPARGGWQKIDKALNFMVSDSVKRYSNSRNALGKRIVSAILRCGSLFEGQHAKVIFYIHDFDSALLRDPAVVEMLSESVIKVRNNALLSTASNAVENIQSLLLSPVISGRDGITDAISGFIKILKSINDSRPSISFSTAYQPLLLIAQRNIKFTENQSLGLDLMQNQLDSILELIINVWEKGKNNPFIFSSFSLFQPANPNPAIIHNWAYASILFSESIPNGIRLLNAIANAKSQPMLADQIILAQATRSITENVNTVTVTEINSENRETFYSVIGRRLVVLQRGNIDSSRKICEALLYQCLRYGPRDIDAAVFLCSLRFEITLDLSHSDVDNYRKRVMNDRSCRLTLIPILDLLEESIKSGH